MTAHATFTPAEIAQVRLHRKTMQALESTLFAARQSSDPVRVLSEALIRQMDCEEFTQVIEAMLTIWNAEPADSDMCPHYGARMSLAEAANDVMHDYALEEGSYYRLRGAVDHAFGPALFRRAN
ncbi:hypothetical protein [Roseinatronobacter alkalisoli]|uniref:Uncharacterized protein n=1 Tax=Roseinatronobacter alkalisoli TaxID=3028235 RepID=A0ABT5TDN1_9RHOB|nr:hypothetical protein [Roseinatronobacter sp. HJB301]MDD7972481.1 hypothetical protein [Roseinatronobacter sp. HJB301]